MRVLLIEDDSATAQSIELMLKSESFNVYTTDLGEEGVDLGKLYDYDIILLDLNLPDMHGYDVLKKLRVAKVQTPVLILSGIAEMDSKVRSFGFGADDYVTKPFSPRELVARVRARLRRAGAVPAASPVSADPWVMRGAFAIDREGHRIRYRQQLLDLTRYEYAVLDALLQRPGAILSRAQLMDRGWDSDADSADRTVDTHVKTLRAKLRAAGADPDPIRTHRGLGYAVEA